MEFEPISIWKRKIFSSRKFYIIIGVFNHYFNDNIY